MSTDAVENTADPNACPLTDREQTRNIIIFASTQGLLYLAAPVIYVGLVQAALFDKLGASKVLSNAPLGVFHSMAIVPVLVAWFVPYVRHLKTVICCGYLLYAGTGAIVVGALCLPTPTFVIPAVLLHALTVGAAGGTIAAFIWETVGRSISERRRGQALALAFGGGPVWAVIGSLSTQFVLEGGLGASPVNGLGFRWDFAVLYGATIPSTVLAAFLATKFIIPQPTVELVRKPFFEGCFGGFGDYFRTRWILIALIAYILVYSGESIMPTITLYTNTAIGADPKDYVGYQQALRFGCKGVAGFFLGWLVTRLHPKGSLVATALMCVAGVLWALVPSGKWFLLSFGFLGAGELMGAYFPNYILSCSAKSKMRRNLAFTSLCLTPVGFVAVIYGQIVDRFASAGNELRGFQMSFSTSLVLLITGIAVVVFGLTRRPQPVEDEARERPGET